MSIHLVLLLVLAGLALVFVIQNVASVEVNFLLWTISMSRALLIILTLGAGFLLGWLLHSYRAYRNARSARDEGRPDPRL